MDLVTRENTRRDNNSLNTWKGNQKRPASSRNRSLFASNASIFLFLLRALNSWTSYAITMLSSLSERLGLVKLHNWPKYVFIDLINVEEAMKKQIPLICYLTLLSRYFAFLVFFFYLYFGILTTRTKILISNINIILYISIFFSCEM